jgi:hypothetical protein
MNSRIMSCLNNKDLNCKVWSNNICWCICNLLFGVVIGTSKLDPNWIPRKGVMVERGNLQKTLEVSTLGENERHIR